MWLPFLLLLLVQSSTSVLKWEDCTNSEATVMCVAYREGSNKYEFYDKDFILQTDRSMLIRPGKKYTWEITIYHKESGTVQLFIDTTPVISCTVNSVSPLKNGAEIETEVADAKMCSFKLSIKDQRKTVAEYLSGTVVGLGKDELTITPVKQFNFGLVPIECNKVADCASDEICQPVTHNPNCDDGYRVMYRLQPSNNYTEAFSFLCTSGDYKIKDSDRKDVPNITPDTSVKCARKKCSLCNFNAKSTSNTADPVFLNSDAYDKCAQLKCKEGFSFMVINDAVPTSGAIECSPETVDGTLENARWVVEDQSMKIETATCKESVPCEMLTPLAKLVCGKGKKDPTCHEHTRNGDTRDVMCKKGAMHLVANTTDVSMSTDASSSSDVSILADVSIDPPICADNGTWIVTFHLTDEKRKPVNRTVLMRTGGELRIKCIDIPAPQLKQGGDSSSWLTVLIVSLVIIIIMIIVVVLIAFFLARRRKTAAPSSSAPTKTSSTAKTSKASSSELEPLTSAIVSVTADSIDAKNAKKDQKRLKLADVTGVTAAAVQTAKEKKEDEKMESKKEEKNESKKEAVESAHPDDKSKLPSVTAVESKEKTALTDPKSQVSKTGGDSQVEKIGDSNKAQISTKTTTKTNKSFKKYKKNSEKNTQKNTDFVNVTDYSEGDDEEASKTGSKKRKPKKKI